MKEGLLGPKVENVGVAVVLEKGEDNADIYNVYLLNLRESGKIEPIMEDVFGLANEYWVSFWVNDDMYDKKFVFLPETISKDKMKPIPELGPGVKGILLI